MNELNISYCSDKYQYTMGKSFFQEGMTDNIAIFNLFFRSAPDKNNWAVVSGTREALQMIKGLGSESEEFFEKFIPGEEYADFRKYLANMKFTGEVYAMKVKRRGKVLSVVKLYVALLLLLVGKERSPVCQLCKRRLCVVERHCPRGVRIGLVGGNKRKQIILLPFKVVMVHHGRTAYTKRYGIHIVAFRRHLRIVIVERGVCLE